MIWNRGWCSSSACRRLVAGGCRHQAGPAAGAGGPPDRDGNVRDGRARASHQRCGGGDSIIRSWSRCNPVLPILFAVGCGTTEPSAHIEVLANVRPDGACAVSTDPSAPSIATGYLDLAFDRPYIAHLLVDNSGPDSVTVDGGWRNVWREPAHAEVISGKGDPARQGLVVAPVEVRGGEREIVDVDVLGAARVRFRRDYEDVIASGGAPLDRDSTTVVVLEGTVGGRVVRAEPWTYGITFGMGRLVDAPAGTDSPSVPGQDCCLSVPSTGCAPGQDDMRGSCSECAGCWPEVCNFAQNPACGGTPLEGCGP